MREKEEGVFYTAENATHKKKKIIKKKIKKGPSPK